MLTDEQLIDRIQSELHEELANIHPPAELPAQVWERAERISDRRGRSLLNRIPRVAAIASALAVVAVVVLTLGTVAVRHHPASSVGKPAGARGEIVAGDGQVLARSVKEAFLKVYPSRLPRARAGLVAEQNRLEQLYKRYHLAGSPLPSPPSTEPTADTKGRAPRGYVLGATTLQGGVPLALGSYVAAHPSQFPGVTVEARDVRRYPLDGLAAQLMGTVGPLTSMGLHDPHFAGVPPGAIVGQSGLEWYYDSFLRAGATLRLSLDVGLQRAGQRALQHAIDANPPANGGAFVAMNPQNGEIYATGSLPTFNPNIFTKPVAESAYAQLNNPSSSYPLLNRAIESAGPVGSLLEPITAIAALQSRAWSVDDTFDDTGQLCFSGQCRHNAGGAVDGELDLVDAIRVSSDDFFYNLGVLTDNPAPRGGALQYWLRQFGIGQRTGVDIGGEDAGTLPTPAWRAHINRLEQECDGATGPFKGKPKHQPGGCGIADGSDRPWSAGDNENLAGGQGDVQVTPLQLAVVYSAIANGGTIVRPHLGASIERTDGSVLEQIDPAPARHLSVNPRYLDAVREGMREAASAPGGTSADVFGNFPEQLYGTTGTAQYNGQQDYAWYAGFVPPSATSKPIVVVVTVQQGGFGAAAAAPVARQILSQWFLGHPGAWTPGKTHNL